MFLLTALSCTLIPASALEGLWSEGGWSPVDSGWSRTGDSRGSADSGDSEHRADSLPPLDSSPCERPPQIEGLELAFGSDGGGDTVIVVGNHFDATTWVEFGKTELSEVTVVDDRRLRIVTPAYASAEKVDVTVGNDCGEDRLEEAFWYFEDAAGEAAAWGVVELFDYQGGYWDSSLRDHARVHWALNLPDQHRFWDYFGTDDACEVDTGRDPITVMLTGLPDSQLQIGSESPFTVPWDGDQLYWSTEFDDAHWAFDAPIQLLPMTSGPLEGLEMQLGTTPTPLVVTHPDMGGDVPPQLSRSQMSFTWDAVTADRIVLQMARSEDGTHIDEVVNCIALNDGSFTVPAGVWPTPWQGTDVIFVIVSAMREDGGTVPLNGGESRVVGMASIMGVVLALPG